MRKILIFTAIVFFANTLIAQENANTKTQDSYQNSSERLMQKDDNLTIGGYGQIDYNQPLSKDVRSNGKLDVHRLVMLFGYKFNKRTQFVTELEFEHVKEVYVEQAFLQYKINDYMNFRGGLILTPMGYINEYHEPVAFNGVERPLVDKYIAPTTWREIGAGFTGNIIDASLKYQAYLMNGFNGYDGDPKLSGKNGLRKGRQKGAESFISSPNLAAKVEYYGIKGLNLGVSGYFGKTQSTLYNGIDPKDEDALAAADSSVVGISMIGLDARYQLKALQVKGQFYYNSLSNTEEYNYFTTVDSIPNNLGSSMQGYYAELGYNVLHHFNSTNELTPFVRYENYNTQNTMAEGFEANDGYNNTIITTGLGWKMAKGAVLKADMQFVKSEAADDYSKIFNAGIGIMF